MKRKKYPPMDRKMRAAQFAPFDALTGYREAVSEAGRMTERRMEISEDQKYILDEKLKMLAEKQSEGERADISITFFEKDPRKEGGKYRTVCGEMKKIDRMDNVMIIEDGEDIYRIPAEDVIDIDFF